MARDCPLAGGPALYLDCQECDQRVCADNYFWCLVVGSRTFNDFERMCAVMDRLLCNQESVFIISGGAKGADQLAERYAAARGFPCRVFPAQWNKYGKGAGYRRNEEMHLFLASHASRGVVAFWDGQSRGTAHNFPLAGKYGSPVRVILPRKENNRGF